MFKQVLSAARALTAVRGALLLTVLCVLPLAQNVLADDYSAGWGPAVGSMMPVLEAPDHTGKVRTLDDLTGDQGLLLFLSRSADW